MTRKHRHIHHTSKCELHAPAYISLVPTILCVAFPLLIRAVAFLLVHHRHNLLSFSHSLAIFIQLSWFDYCIICLFYCVHVLSINYGPLFGKFDVILRLLTKCQWNIFSFRCHLPLYALTEYAVDWSFPLIIKW